jgi:tetratricopeptide (TPR) repeat protein
MRRAFAGFLAAFTAVVLYGVSSGCEQRATGTLTFDKDIAPIVFENCSSCHRPGGGAPFSLLTYEDVRARSKQIAVVTGSRYMPPWLPTAGRGEFAGERTLSTDAIGRIAQWSQEGCKEGSAGDLPPVPKWPEGWTLGTPDLVLELPEAYELAADGSDIYRNFVLSVPLEKPVYVRALEFNPGNPRVVHHAFVFLDPTRESRRLDEESPEPGFGDLVSMALPDSVVNPGDDGFFNGWNPGTRPFRGYDDMAWPLDATNDVVLQLHLRPSGKTERVKPSIAFYFAEKAPTRFPLVIGLRSAFLDIPAGEANYSFEMHYTLPVDVDVLAILPHAHYIGKELQGLAELPDGTKEWLIHIADWDFNWQGSYRYEKPVFLPKGTRITQRYSYDNSSSNLHNPVSPPKRVRNGGSSLDEMGELWLQVLTRRREDREVLREHFTRCFVDGETRAAEAEIGLIADETERKALETLAKNPADWSALFDMARCRGRQNRIDEAIEYAKRAVEAAPNEAEPHCMLGHLLLGRPDALTTAFDHLALAIKIDPKLAKAHIGMGLALKKRGNPAAAAQSFTTAHELTPEDPFPLFHLGVLAAEQGEVTKAVEMFEKALNVEPRFKPARDALDRIAAQRSGGLTKQNTKQ